ncbi:MAG: hypothetical protein M1838_005469 [Thelocarpon superellum]|nr:MAG: hypothetical protein M1838_005469 [Thelocarpon superellum]
MSFPDQYANMGDAERPEDVMHHRDPALDPAHQHHHAHLHHDANAERGRVDEVVYTTGTTFEPSMIPDESPQDHHVHPHLRQHPAFQPDSTEGKNDMVILDAEKGAVETIQSTTDTSDSPNHAKARFYVKYRIVFHIIVFLLVTAWWVASLILHREDKSWVLPFLFWLCVTLRLVFFHVPITVVTKPMHWLWHQTGVRAVNLVPEKLRLPAGAALVMVVIFVGSFVSPETADNSRSNRAVSLFGLLVFIGVLWATSKDRKAIQWHTVIMGMFLQFVIALFVLRTQTGYDIFNAVSDFCRNLLDNAQVGTAFLTTPETAKLTWFIISVLPAIIFFVGLVQLLYYYGFIQWFIGKLAVFFFWSMRVSGAEAVVAAASPFIGQGESAMLIKPFVAHLTLAELHQVMTSGFATIAGSVLVAYIALGVNPQALISSCVMSIPASLAISKLRYPETEDTLTSGRVVIPDDDEDKAANGLHAFANGAWLGLKIAGMILSTLLCILALLAFLDSILTWFGNYININSPPLTIELVVGYLCYPIAFLLGVPRDDDLLKVSKLIGTKLIANEFVAYHALQTDPEYANISPRSRLIATYALCGFANLGSLGTQIGVLSQLAPGRSGDVSRLALSALLTGAISTFTSASVAGLLVTNQAQFFSPTKAAS